MRGACASRLAIAAIVLTIWFAHQAVASPVSYRAEFDQLSGWADDDHAAAFSTFYRSCKKIVAVSDARIAKGQPSGDELTPLLDVCKRALVLPESLEISAAKTFFEDNFTPRPVEQNSGRAYLTGYFEPELPGSREQSERFSIPVLAKPDDLVPLVEDTHRAAHNHELTYGRKSKDGIVAYDDRKAIEAGALSGRGLEIVFLADRFDTYIMHVQGSGRVVLPDGSTVRLAYAAKNGHPYTSIGRILIERGEIDKDAMSLDALEAWVRSNPDAAKELMWENRSYIFFRELEGWDPGLGPPGGQGVALTPGRSLAVDASIHNLGTPIWVEVPAFKDPAGSEFRRLMVAQDVGSAIKGAGRGDIFWGSGVSAGNIAGKTRHPGRFWTLVPRKTEPNK